MRHLICPFWSNKCAPSIRLSSIVVWASHFLWNDLSASEIYLVLSAAYLWCCENRDFKSFSLPPWQVALTPYAKLTSRKTGRFFFSTSAPFATEHKYHNMGHSHVQLEEEISSDKEQLSMQLVKKLLFELNVDFYSCAFAGKRTTHLIDYLIVLYKQHY